MHRRQFLALAGSAAGLLAGCLGGAADPDAAAESPTATSPAPPSDDSASETDDRSPTAGGTASPSGERASTEFSDGPKSEPARPDELTAERVAAYVRTYEYRYVYNTLWYDESSEVTLECEEPVVSKTDEGYRARITCTGYSNTGGAVADATETATVLHADYFTREWVYLVTETETIRRRPDRVDAETESPPPSKTNGG